MIPSRLSLLTRLLLLVSTSFVLAANLSHWMLPGRSGLTAMDWPVHWIEPDSPSKRAYYRSTVDVPFTPIWAWVSIAAEDYIVYVNGHIASSNNISADSTRPLQSQISDQAQSTTPFSTPVAYGPELRRAGNSEWLFPQHTQIASYLQPGRNVIGVLVQSPAPSGAQFAIQGEILGEGQRVAIPAKAQDWKASTVSTLLSGQPWYSPLTEGLDWPPAKTGALIDQSFYATAPPAIWETMMPRVGLTGPTSGGDLRFGLGLPGVAPGENDRGWIRVYSNWLYYLFIGNQLVGQGGGDGTADAWDLTSFLSPIPQRLSLRLVRQTGPFLSPLEIQSVPLVVVDGQIGSRRFSSESGWQRMDETDPQWLSGVGSSSLATLATQDRPPSAVGFQYPAELGLSWTSRFAVLWLACATGLFALYYALRFGERLRGRPPDSRSAAAVWILSLPIVGIIVAEALQLRLAGTDSILLFTRPENLRFVQILGPFFLAAAIAAYYTAPTRAAAPRPWTDYLSKRLPPLALIAIIAVALGLRVYNIGFEDLQADEKVSWDAAAGVLRTGLPVEYSGIFYTRSALYHEVLAGWLTLFGNTKVAARMFAVIPGVLSVWFTYRLTLLASGGRRIPALIAALVIAVDPWELRNTQNIRFYQQVQTLSILSMEMFLLGFVARRGKLYQNIFFVLASMACFSQEVFVLTFPGFCIAALYFYRPWRWRENINVCIGFVVVLSLAIYDILIFEVMTLTANNGISGSDLPAMMLHVLSVSTLTLSFFVGQAQIRLLFAIMFFCGALYWMRRSNRYIATLYIQIVCGVTTGTILVMQIQNRYVYLFYPFLVVIAVVTSDAILRDVASTISAFAGSGAEALSKRWLRFAGGLAAIGLLMNMEPGKVLQSYNWATITQEESGFRYVVDHRLPGDAVLANLPDSVASVVGDLDYALTDEIQFDTLYQPGNEIVDRWAGGTLLSNLDMLRKALLTHDRVWMVLSDVKVRNYPKTWQDMLASAETKYEWFGGKVLLWERKAGAFPLTADGGGAANSY